MEKRGVFLRSESNLDSALMIKCLQTLHNNYPSIKFSSISSDEKLSGFRVCFTEPEEAVILKKNQLEIANQPIWIYPLTAYLVILDIKQNTTPLFERDLKAAISRKFGTILNVKTDSFYNHKNWHVHIDIPEFKELEVFRCSDLSEMTISIPNRNETLKVAFWCRHCQKGGHFQHECPTRDHPATSAKSQVNSNGSTNDNCNNDTQIRDNLQTQSDSKSPVKNSETPPKESADVPLEPTEIYAEKIGREEVLSGILTGENQNLKKSESSPSAAGTTNTNLLPDNEIKKEVEEHKTSADIKTENGAEGKTRENSKNDKEIAGNSFSTEESRRMFNEDNSNASNGVEANDDDIQIIEMSNRKSPVESRSPNSNFATKAAELSNFEDDSKSPRAARNYDFSIPSFTTTPGPSFETPSAPRPRGAEVTAVLSTRLQDCINHACENVGVLDRQKLDAFLIHVKKKSNPARVAWNYTKNEKGLKEQLQKILYMYYNTPQTGTKEDIQFIKWLNGLVDRFDGTIPRKRKRAGQSDGEPSNKK